MWHIRFKVLSPTPEPSVILFGTQPATTLYRALRHMARRLTWWLRRVWEGEASTKELRLTLHLHLRRVDLPRSSGNGAPPNG